jgi:thiol:disulfide interchange protein DsbA
MMKNHLHNLGLCIVWVCIGLFAFLSAQAADYRPVQGRDYITLENPIQTTVKANQVEVVEFFNYSCPHCNTLQPRLHAWLKKQPATVVMRHIPVGGFGGPSLLYQKLYYTLEVLGKLDELNPAVFRAVHVHRNYLASDKAIFAWAGEQNLDVDQFKKTFNSFTVMSKVNRATVLTNQYQVDGTPSLFVDGSYKLLNNSRLFDTMDALIEQVLKAKNKNGG